jgi:NTE family protein
MGSIIAAYYALYKEVKSIEKIAKEFRKRDLVRLIDLNNPRKSLIKGRKVRAYLKKYLGNKTFKDCKIPLRISATYLEDGSEHVFKEGKLVDAIMTSGAFPGVFPAVKYKSKYLVDGGLSIGTPVQLVKDMGAEVIVAVDLISSEYLKRDYSLMTNNLLRSYELVLSKLADYKEKEYGDNIVVLRPKLGTRIQTFAFFRSYRNIKKGEKYAQKYVGKIKDMMK